MEALRTKFEKWVMSTEHEPYGWLGQEWLDRLGDSYMDSYVHGLWVAYQKWAVVPPKIVNEALKWIEFDRHDPSKRPELGTEVFVRYIKPWPNDNVTVVISAVLDKPFEDDDFLCWYNGLGEALRGVVTRWMPMIEDTNES